MDKRKQELINNFNPNGIGIENGNFIGLPFDYETSDVILFPVPWDATVSYHDGTCMAPQNILDASYQLDLHLEEYPNAWHKGIYFYPIDTSILDKNKDARKTAKEHIQRLENQIEILPEHLQIVNTASRELNQWVYEETKKIISDGKKIILVGGDHSTPLGYLKALSEKYGAFGILQIDAHCDLRKAYEGFEYSHASIFHNALNEIPEINHLSQIGIRDFCEEEMEFIKNDNRISMYSDYSIRKQKFQGNSFDKIIDKIISELPENIYISFDIDGLDPKLCPDTGTPVPGGLDFNEAIFILNKIKEKNKKVIGCDLCEVSGKNEWDGNVGARIIYHLTSII